MSIATRDYAKTGSNRFTWSKVPVTVKYSFEQNEVAPFWETVTKVHLKCA